MSRGTLCELATSTWSPRWFDASGVIVLTELLRGADQTWQAVEVHGFPVTMSDSDSCEQSKMSDKRTAADAASAAAWKRFVAEQRQLLSTVGFPLYLLEAKSRFDHWLMHGVHPQDASQFCSDELTAATRVALAQVVEAYLAAGFRDPGISIFRNGELGQVCRKELCK